jgi:hypothetical protein
MSPTVAIRGKGLIDGTEDYLRSQAISDIHALFWNGRQLLKTFADSLISPRV